MDSIMALVVVASVATWNNALHLAPRRWRDVVVTVGIALGGVLGAAWLFSAIDPLRGVGDMWPWIGGAAVASGSVALVALVSPTVGRHLADRRIVEMSTPGFVTHTLVRIPIVTALCEEILFRGVAWSLLALIGGPSLAWWGSSLAFALGHVVVATQQARREGHPSLRWVLTTLVMTGLAGALLGWLRLTTDAIWASVGVHATVNVVLALAARGAARRHGLTATIPSDQGRWRSGRNVAAPGPGGEVLAPAAGASHLP